ncbi:hypothetical protein B0H13DRAFT_543799 [Mycena leptocephala]|nr:hypothetical protein B0H13DRAFT_543799 [Mycena leptocephala]
MPYLITFFIVPLILIFQPSPGTALATRISCDDTCSPIFPVVTGDSQHHHLHEHHRTPVCRLPRLRTATVRRQLAVEPATKL